LRSVAGERGPSRVAVVTSGASGIGEASCRLLAGMPEDSAVAATFLASEQAGFITGQVLGVNGGSVL
jgi:NAD(P)-dependent dehydrogenase (short-subunit alcohol dehydrogenase family)